MTGKHLLIRTIFIGLTIFLVLCITLPLQLLDSNTRVLDEQDAWAVFYYLNYAVCSVIYLIYTVAFLYFLRIIWKPFLILGTIEDNQED